MSAYNTTRQQVALWSAKAQEATIRRNEGIRQMKEEGASLRDIAEAANLSHTAIAKILARI